MQRVSLQVSLSVTLALVLAHTAASPSRAQDAGDRQVVSLFDNCDGDTAARIRFLEDSLEDNRSYANYYFGGWLGFYTVGAGYSSYHASTNERGERAVHILSAIKAVGGIGRIIYWRPNAMRGADSSRALPANNAEQCSRRLSVAEETLKQNVHEGNAKWRWPGHVINAMIHATGAVIVGEVWGARKDAWASAGLGLVVGEAVLWTLPWQAGDTLEEYERRFPATGLPPEPRVSWGVAPTVGGAGFYLRF